MGESFDRGFTRSLVKRAWAWGNQSAQEMIYLEAQYYEKQKFSYTQSECIGTREQ